MPISDAQLRLIHSGIRAMQSKAEELLTGSEDLPALNRNIRRIQASLKMLELDICDPLDLDEPASR